MNTASAAGLANTAYTPTGTTDMAYTVAKNGVTLLSESLNAAMRAREAPIAVHVLCPYGTASSILVNATKFEGGTEFKDEASKAKAQQRFQKFVDKAEKDPMEMGMISAERGAQILQECIEIGRFYVSTPDRTASTNTSRAWMLGRAEDFITDALPFTNAPGTDGFRKIMKDVSGRAKSPNHTFSPDGKRIAGRSIYGKSLPKSKM